MKALPSQDRANHALIDLGKAMEASRAYTTIVLFRGLASKSSLFCQAINRIILNLSSTLPWSTTIHANYF